MCNPGSPKSCLNNSAVTMFEPSVENSSQWYGTSSEINLRDVISFVNDDKEPSSQLLSFCPSRIDTAISNYILEKSSFKTDLVTCASGKFTFSSSRLDAGKYSIITERSSSTQCKITDQAKNSEADTNTGIFRTKKIIAYDLIWESPISPHSYKRAKQILFQKMAQKRSLINKYVWTDWRAEVHVYAQLGYWAPEYLPKSFHQNSEKMPFAECVNRWQARANRTFIQNFPPCSQVNSAKKFLHRYGGLNEFYQYILDGRLEYDALNSAVQLCNFRLSIGLRRNLGSYEETQLRKQKKRKPSVNTLTQSEQEKLANRQSRRATRVASPLDLKGMLNPSMLLELNALRPFGLYQRESETSSVGDRCVSEHSISEETRTVSRSSCISSLGDFIEDSDFMAMEPLSGTVQSETNNKVVAEGNKEQVASKHSGEKTESSVTSLYETVVDSEHQTEKVTLDKENAVKPDTENRSVLNMKERKANTFSYKSKVFASTMSKSDRSLERWPEPKRHIWHCHKQNCLDLNAKMPVNELMKNLSDILTRRKKYRNKWWQSRKTNDMTTEVLRSILKGQPLVAKLLREKFQVAGNDGPCTGRQLRTDETSTFLSSNETQFFLPMIVEKPLPALQSSFSLEIASGSKMGGKQGSFSYMTDVKLPSHSLSSKFYDYPHMKTDPTCYSHKGKTSSLGGESMMELRRSYKSSMASQPSVRITREQEKHNTFLLPYLPPKPGNLLLAASNDLREFHPFILDFYRQSLNQSVSEGIWEAEHNMCKLSLALERVGADLLLYRQSSGHSIRYKVMSILTAVETNKALRRQLCQSAVLQGNWLDQTLRTLSSVQPTCRTEAALVLAKLATQEKLMQELMTEKKCDVIGEIFYSLFRAADFYPKSWPDCYMAIAFLLHHNQEQVIVDAIIDKGIKGGTHSHASYWPRLLALVYTYWQPANLERLNLNEKRIVMRLDAALANPITKKIAKEAVAAISKYHRIKCNLFTT